MLCLLTFGVKSDCNVSKIMVPTLKGSIVHKMFSENWYSHMFILRSFHNKKRSTTRIADVFLGMGMCRSSKKRNVDNVSQRIHGTGVYIYIYTPNLP